MTHRHPPAWLVGMWTCVTVLLLLLAVTLLESLSALMRVVDKQQPCSLGLEERPSPVPRAAASTRYLAIRQPSPLPSPSSSSSVSVSSTAPLPVAAPRPWSGLAALHDYAAFHRLALLQRAHELPTSNRFHSSTNRSTDAAPGFLISLEKGNGPGYGNQINAILSHFYLAMATRRIFLLHDARVQEALLPNAIQWADAAGRRNKPDHHVFLTLNVDEALGCGDLQQLWQQHTVITASTTQYYLPLISHNPHVAAWSQHTFGSDAPNSFAAHLLAFLFTPSAQLSKIIVDFTREHAFRPVEPDPYQPQGWSGRFWRPAADASLPHRPIVGLQVRRDKTLFGDRDAQTFFLCAQALQQQGLRVFIATDNQQSTRELAQRLLPAGTEILMYSGALAAMVDLFLLSLTDQLIITWPRSTFGNLAAALSGSAPWSVHGSSEVRGICTRQLHSEPCFHGWYRRRWLSCYNASTFETYEMLNADNCYQCNAGCTDNDQVQLDRPSDVVCPLGSCIDKLD